MGYSISSYGKATGGFFVNTSAVAAKGLDVSIDASKSERILTVAIKEERAQAAYSKAVANLKLSDEAFLRSLEDGSFFSQQSTPSYKGSSYSGGNSYSGGYAGGSYGQFINGSNSADESELARYGLLGQNYQATSTPQVDPMSGTPASEVQEATSTGALAKIKAFLLKHKFFVLLAAIVALVVAFRKK